MRSYDESHKNPHTMTLNSTWNEDSPSQMNSEGTNRFSPRMNELLRIAEINDEKGICLDPRIESGI